MEKYSSKNILFNFFTKNNETYIVKSKKNNILYLDEESKSIDPSELNNQIKQFKKKEREICEQAARTILYALDCKDHYTFGHSLRVAYYSTLLGRELKMNQDELYELELSALFHDIGKISIPDHILCKSSRLNEEEFNKMKEHPVKSYEILNNFEPFKNIAKYIKYHHERYDGKGYPEKLKGDEIPFISRIILIADSFDAITSTRPYRKRLSNEVAFSELIEFSGHQFDPNLVKTFIEIIKRDSQKNEKTFRLTIMKDHYKKAA